MRLPAALCVALLLAPAAAAANEPNWTRDQRQAERDAVFSGRLRSANLAGVERWRLAADGTLELLSEAGLGWSSSSRAGGTARGLPTSRPNLPQIGC